MWEKNQFWSRGAILIDKMAALSRTYHIPQINSIDLCEESALQETLNASPAGFHMGNPPWSTRLCKKRIWKSIEEHELSYDIA